MQFAYHAHFSLWRSFDKDIDEFDQLSSSIAAASRNLPFPNIPRVSSLPATWSRRAVRLSRAAGNLPIGSPVRVAVPLPSLKSAKACANRQQMAADLMARQIRIAIA
jgi:hypothetical protein